jgi:2-keto-4-pentenoate hydratase
MSRPSDDSRIVRGMTAQLERLDAALGEGERPLGWKVGFGSPAAMERLGIDAPLVGHLVSGARIGSGGVVSLDGWSNPIAEPEVAVHMGEDLPDKADRETAVRAIAGLGPAIELVDLYPPPEDVEEILACDLYQRGVVLGPMDRSRHGGSADGLVGRVCVGEREQATDDVTAMTGDLIDLIRHVAGVLAGFGRRLEAGQVVITGSIVPPVGVHPGDRLRFELDPIGAVAVRFAATASEVLE